ncbi:MAG: hypothetical protein ACK5MR_16835 [Cumulibacter sp.]
MKVEGVDEITAINLLSNKERHDKLFEIEEPAPLPIEPKDPIEPEEPQGEEENGDQTA